jgi:hypothetical protein
VTENRFIRAFGLSLQVGATDARSLRDALNSAAQLLDGGQMRSATNSIRRFRHRVGLLVESGRVLITVTTTESSFDAAADLLAGSTTCAALRQPDLTGTRCTLTSSSAIRLAIV